MRTLAVVSFGRRLRSIIFLSSHCAYTPRFAPWHHDLTPSIYTRNTTT
jgi:hypothetical protein